MRMFSAGIIFGLKIFSFVSGFLFLSGVKINERKFTCTGALLFSGKIISPVTFVFCKRNNAPSLSGNICNNIFFHCFVRKKTLSTVIFSLRKNAGNTKREDDAQ